MKIVPEVEQAPAHRLQRTSRLNVEGGVVVVHNHWIHYKDLLFRELDRHLEGFRVILTAGSSKARLDPPDLRRLPYRCETLTTESYERSNKFWCAAVVFARLCALRPAVVIVSGWYDAVSWAAWAWAQLWRRPLVLWAESNEFDHPRRWWREALKGVFVRGCQQGHVYGTSNAHYLIKLGMDTRKILTKRAVLDVEHFRRIGDQRTECETRVLLYVGRISEEKNLRRLVNAFARVHQERHAQRLELWIAGYGPMRVALEQLAAGLGLAGCVKFLGPVTQERLPAVYSQADLFILPSTCEPWGLVVNEAMCCELPVLVSNRCGCAADLVNEETGWVVDPYDEQAMAEAISQAANLPRERLLAMGRAGRRVSQEYSPAHCAARVVEGLRRVRSS